MQDQGCGLFFNPIPYNDKGNFLRQLGEVKLIMQQFLLSCRWHLKTHHTPQQWYRSGVTCLLPSPTSVCSTKDRAPALPCRHSQDWWLPASHHAHRLLPEGASAPPSAWCCTLLRSRPPHPCGTTCCKGKLLLDSLPQEMLVSIAGHATWSVLLYKKINYWINYLV